MNTKMVFLGRTDSGERKGKNNRKIVISLARSRGPHLCATAFGRVTYRVVNIKRGFIKRSLLIKIYQFLHNKHL
jgi:hypothetical protein